MWISKLRTDSPTRIWKHLDFNSSLCRYSRNMDEYSGVDIPWMKVRGTQRTGSSSTGKNPVWTWDRSGAEESCWLREKTEQTTPWLSESGHAVVSDPSQFCFNRFHVYKIWYVICTVMLISWQRVFKFIITISILFLLKRVKMLVVVKNV